jgi:hypothetical protein
MGDRLCQRPGKRDMSPSAPVSQRNITEKAANLYAFRHSRQLREFLALHELGGMRYQHAADLILSMVALSALNGISGAVTSGSVWLWWKGVSWIFML